MVIESVANLFTPDGFSQFLGWLMLFLLFVYVIIAFVITRAVSLMNKSFKTKAMNLFKFFGYLHFLLASLLFLVSLILLL